jgi:hypothetical protein
MPQFRISGPEMVVKSADENSQTTSPVQFREVNLQLILISIDTPQGLRMHFMIGAGWR